MAVSFAALCRTYLHCEITELLTVVTGQNESIVAWVAKRFQHFEHLKSITAKNALTRML